ncbi:MAG: J domain-containing protein, partial [Deltaproteobacteria bacterium]|nr:J domain-containing protein [Deltaproteobacteria bacterium]
MNNGYVSDLADRDPWKILGVAPDSGPEEIRRAYLKKIKESPPDRAPEKFELIR